MSLNSEHKIKQQKVVPYVVLLFLLSYYSKHLGLIKMFFLQSIKLQIIKEWDIDVLLVFLAKLNSSCLLFYDPQEIISLKKVTIASEGLQNLSR